MAVTDTKGRGSAVVVAHPEPGDKSDWWIELMASGNPGHSHSTRAVGLMATKRYPE